MDFDVSNMSISDSWVRLLETDYFLHSAIKQDFFFSQNQGKEFFYEKKKQAHPEYQMDRA